MGAGLGNVVAYLLSVASARLLDVADFGAVVALLGLFLVCSVPGLALQTAIAREVSLAASTGAPAWGAARALVPSVAVALGAALLASFAVPLVVGGSVAATAGLALSAAAGTGAFALQGLVQGASRFGLLGLLLLITAVGRCGGALVALVAGVGGVGGVLLGHGLGLALALATGLALVRPTLRPAAGPGAALWRTLGSGILGIGGFLLLANADVPLARRLLDDDLAGLYAAGALVAKIGLWLPQFLALVATPGLADPGRRASTLRTALVRTVAVTAALVAGAAVVGGRALSIVLGPEFGALGARSALFAAAGGALATVYLLLLAALAGTGRTLPAATWLALLGFLVTALVLRPAGVTGLVLILLGWVGALAAVGVVLERRELSRPVPASRAGL